MKTANLSDVKNDLSRYVDHVRRGGRVRILVRGLPAADIVPVEEGTEKGGDGATDAELRDLERRGVIRRGTPRFPRELDKPGPRVRGGAAVRAVIEERRAGR